MVSSKKGTAMILAAARLLAVACLLAIATAAARADETSADQAAIRALARATWERADAPLSVEPIVVHDGYAIAGWVQDDRGGRALLRKGKIGWEVILCAGDHLKSAETVMATGAPAAIAEPLVAKLAKAEAGMPSDRRAKFAMFDTIMRIDHGPKKHGH